MTMQDALRRASTENLFARPTEEAHYRYRYEDHGRNRLVHVHGRDRYGVSRSDFWRTLSQSEIESEWIVCDSGGDPVDPTRTSGLTIAELAS